MSEIVKFYNEGGWGMHLISACLLASIGITIERNADVCLVLLHGALQIRQVLAAGRVGMMVRKVAIRLAVKRDYVATERSKKLRRNHAAYTIAGIHHYFETTIEFDVAGDAREVGGHDVVVRHTAVAADQLVVLDTLAQA